MKKLFLVCALLFVGMDASASPRDMYSGLLGSDLNAHKKDVLAYAMQFTPGEEPVFWPIYNDYRLEMEKLYASRRELIQEYAAVAGTISDQMAWSIAEQAFDLDERELELRKKFYKKFEQKLPPSRVAQFFHVEKQINLVMQLQLASRFSRLNPAP